MSKCILVPLDGFSFSEQALPLALALAQRTEAPLHLVRVYLPPEYLTDADLGFSSNLYNEMRSTAYQYLTRTARHIMGLTNLGVTTALPEGPVAEALAREARTVNADLIVMTTHGRGPLSRMWLGSVADQVIRQAPVLVLLVRTVDGPVQATEVPELRHVLIAQDGHELAKEIIEPAVALGSLFKARYTLVRNIQPKTDFNVAFPECYVEVNGELLLEKLHALEERLKAEARADLERIAEPLRARGLAVETAITHHPQTATGILEFAQSHDVDLIALETHGRHGLPRLFLGSVADKVLRGATVPVLVQRPLPEPVVKPHAERTAECPKTDEAMLAI